MIITSYRVYIIFVFIELISDIYIINYIERNYAYRVYIYNLCFY